MTARTVTGKTVLPSGSAQTSQTVTFVKRSTTISGITVTQASPPITATTNSSGEFSASLDCPADGSTQWTIMYPDGGEFDFTLPYGDGSSVAVTTLISAATVDADAVTLLLDGYEPDLGNPGTSGHVLSSTTAGVRSWVAQSGGGAVDSVFGRTGAVVAASGDYAASQVSDDSGEGQANVKDALDSLRGSANDAYDYIDTHQAATTSVHGITDTAALLTTSAIGSTVQAYSAKTAAIAALTWAANNIILLTGTATASVQALAAHVVTFLQSASAADARTAIGAGTGSGDVTGPASSTANGIPTFSGTGGKTLQSNAATLSDLGGSDGITINGVQTIRSNGTSSIRLARGSTGALLATFLTDTGTLTETSGFKWRNHSGINSWYALAGYWLGYEGNTWDRIYGAGFLTRKITGIDGTGTTVYANGTGDVTLVLSGTFTVSDGAGNVAGGVITATAPSGTFNLYDDGGTNTCQLQVAADGSVTVIRTAGSRTYAVNLQLNWM